ncbi:MAG: hypothetical protein CVU49_07875 [Candidatus Cloacimonetes bacterium HGW-Cloacimonetes-2]|jgi:ribosomal 30S subunit maturation factor RimM|nr:MAG: hypothetical protein CVU49_07875 [Candidatus Cloacimonetes bacterium HGW-Cloacimonetes-2]
MNLQDLIGIGRLGGLDADGYYHIMVKPQYRDLLQELDEVFLIFNSDRVFYVSISELKETDKKIWIKFREDGIRQERQKHREVILAVAPEDMESEDDELDALIGAIVLHQGKQIGTLRSYFHNNAQYVLEIESSDEQELLVPFVDHFVSSADAEAAVIELTNLEELIPQED